uniref:NB-ARC domain-containing protein n=1 Tax=Quercus lobata TaxID=97700 RepID=A0A7N2L6E1_QUELO
MGEEQSMWSEAEVIQEIVQRISEQKLSSTKISIAKHPVGIESHVQEISKLLAINPEEVRKVGIYGCQGVGKTTIAKAIYNRHASQFDGCSFLMNVRDKSKVQYQMVELQELLLHEILGEDMKLGNVDTGITVIKEKLRHKRVLIVIDGVESTDPNPLDKLAGGLDWFGPGSRIIITTTEESVLKTQDDVPSIYPVKTMGQSDAIQLFSWYAFKKNKPEVDYMKLVKAVVRHSKGLPSALVKLGSDLCSRSKDYWESELSKYNAIEGENHDDIWIRRLNDLVERHYNDETGEMHPSLLQLLNGTLESPSNNVHVPNFNMNALEQCDDVDWNDDFDLQSIKFEQSAEETSLPDADEISKQGMKAWEGQNENPYAGATQDVEKGEQWRNASQGGSKNPYHGELGDDDAASQGGNYDPYYGGARNDDEDDNNDEHNDDDNDGQGASESPYYGGPTDHGVAGQSGNYNLYYGGARNDDDAGQGTGEKPYYGGPTDHGGARNDDDDNDNDDEHNDDDGQGASESPYYSGPTDHGVAGQSGNYNLYHGGARNAAAEDDDNDGDGELEDDEDANKGENKNQYVEREEYWEGINENPYP